MTNPNQSESLLNAARRVLRDHEITDLEDGGRVYVDALALAALRDAVRSHEAASDDQRDSTP